MKQIIYSKFSNERNYRFAIRTDICEDENGQRSVRKVCSCPEGQLHMTELYRWYQIFSEACKGTWLSYNRCEIIPGGVELEYVEGKTLEECLEEVEKIQGVEAMAELFLKYLYAIRDMHSSMEFQETAKFRNVFGDFLADPKKLGLRCAPVTNIDLICENILLKDGQGTVIDYEWSFDFPVPVNYLLYRNIFYFREHAGRNYLLKYDFYKELGITREEIIAYDKMEENLQHYVCRDHIPVRDLYEDVSPGMYQVDYTSHTEWLQIYYDDGKGLREEHSRKFAVKDGKVEGKLFLKPEWKLLRIDPGSVSGFVEIKKLEIDGKDMTSNLQVADGIRSGSYVCFTQNDPNMMLAELPENARELEIALRIWPVDQIPMEKAAQWVWQLEVQSQTLKQMENTRVWKVYQKYRKAVERKHS